MSEPIISQLVNLSNRLGEPANDYAIMGEGNTSARVDRDTFLVKASGYELRTISAEGFSHVHFGRVLGMLERTHLSDDEVKDCLNAAKVDSSVAARPSVETLLHAICLQLEGVNFVGHTHPTAVNSLTCSVGYEAAFQGRLFPDEIVSCGPAPLLVPYIDPGVPLARHIRQMLDQYRSQYGGPPRVILMQNHGMIALGRDVTQVLNITAMMVKTARILLGTYAAGGPHFMPAHQVERIHTRPDELYRRRLLSDG